VIGLKTPIEAVSPRAAAASMAVVRGARTMREVAAACGFGSLQTAQRALIEAQEYGLVFYEQGGVHGTLRPLFEVVANTPR